MQIKITTLCENTVALPGFRGEWGLSILVQVNNHNILFDTGAESAAVRNADKIGFDLKTISTIILSHAHGDHTGGLRKVLQRTDHPEIIAHPALLLPKFKKVRPGEPAVFNGLPYRKEEIEKSAEMLLSKVPVKRADRIMTSGEIAQTTDFEGVDKHFYLKENGELLRDHFADEQALIIQTAAGLVIISGCAHRGIINTIRHAQKITGEKRVHTIVGGTHLYPKEPGDIDKTISELLAMEIKHIGVSHCTGLPAALQLSSALGERFFLNNAGCQHTLQFDD